MPWFTKKFCEKSTGVLGNYFGGSGSLSLHWLAGVSLRRLTSPASHGEGDKAAKGRRAGLLAGGLTDND
jgi:hypothetical protein